MFSLLEPKDVFLMLPNCSSILFLRVLDSLFSALFLLTGLESLVVYVLKRLGMS